MEALLHGVILAFGLILPLGVQNVFIFNQGAIHKRFTGTLPAVVTAGICDTLLISLAVAGVSIIVLNFEWLRNLLFIVGFLFLAYMGWSIWKTSGQGASNGRKELFSAKRQVAFAASVSLLNPHAILDTIGVIGTASLVYAGVDKWLFTIACIVVSWIWFFALAMTGRKVGQFDQRGSFLKRLNQVSALVVWGMAIYMGYMVLAH
ncbi:amino acid transporter [Neobacillus notoginsengisoli]|uniref:Amino acid transporter n=1 Tax=Neobacillus notoginsengisoli TaxID=1578198 RepID=A0A417YVJ3_9BACI|nr:LysE/ArgO family amino acid transporter [Neobacillus notoginsengisoli]RHW41443.1 amino acid transporter [Neobacillus notoginsengisoli]